MLFELILWSAKYDPITKVPEKLRHRMANDREAYIKEIRARFL